MFYVELMGDMVKVWLIVKFVKEELVWFMGLFGVDVDF